MWSVAFSPDGQAAASGSWVWDTGLEAWQERVYQVAHRNPSLEEVEDYFGGVTPPDACPALDGR